MRGAAAAAGIPCWNMCPGCRLEYGCGGGSPRAAVDHRHIRDDKEASGIRYFCGSFDALLLLHPTPISPHAYARAHSHPLTLRAAHPQRARALAGKEHLNGARAGFARAQRRLSPLASTRPSYSSARSALALARDAAPVRASVRAYTWQTDSRSRGSPAWHVAVSLLLDCIQSRVRCDGTCRCRTW